MESHPSTYDQEASTYQPSEYVSLQDSPIDQPMNPDQSIDSLRESLTYNPSQTLHQGSQNTFRVRSRNQIVDQHQYMPPQQQNASNEEIHINRGLNESLVGRIYVLEKRLDKGWYIIYTFWLYGMMMLTFLILARESIYFANYLATFGFYGWHFVALIAVFVACIWHFRHCWIELQAISTKQLLKARKALKSMVGFTMYFFVFIALIFIFYIPSFAVIYRIYDDGGLFLIFLGVCAFIIIITITGAKKVRDVLEKVDSLQSRLDTSVANA